MCDVLFEHLAKRQLEPKAVAELRMFIVEEEYDSDAINLDAVDNVDGNLIHLIRNNRDSQQLEATFRQFLRVNRS